MSTGSDNLRDLGDKLISSILNSDEDSVERRKRLFRFASPKLFRGEAYVLYRVLYSFREKNITPDEEFISLYLMNNRKLLTSSSKYIDIGSYGDIDGDEVSAYVAGVLEYFRRLKSSKPDEDFDLLFEKYLLEFKRIELNRALVDSNTILTDSLVVNRQTLSGYEDSVAYFKKRSAEIDGLVDANQGKGFRTMEDVMQDNEDKGESVKVSDFHMIDELNEHLGGIYSGMMYLVLAPPKAGKSKFCTRMAHQAMVEYGQNVTVWAVEGGSSAWLAQLRAIHFDWMYNNGVDITQQKFGVSQGAIISGNLEPELAALEESSRLDLMTNQRYGKVHFIDRPFLVETFLEEIDTSIRDNNSTVLVVDYMQLISSRNSRMSERERIANSYPRLLKYIKDNGVAALLPAQYSQESVKDMLKMNDISKADTRVMGGGSSEMTRTTDFLISLWATTEDIKNHKMTILPSTARFSSVSDKIDLYVDGASCLFSSIKN